MAQANHPLPNDLATCAGVYNQWARYLAQPAQDQKAEDVTTGKQQMQILALRFKQLRDSSSGTDGKDKGKEKSWGKIEDHIETIIREERAQRLKEEEQKDRATKLKELDQRRTRIRQESGQKSAEQARHLEQQIEHLMAEHARKDEELNTLREEAANRAEVQRNASLHLDIPAAVAHPLPTLSPVIPPGASANIKRVIQFLFATRTSTVFTIVIFLPLFATGIDYISSASNANNTTNTPLAITTTPNTNDASRTPIVLTIPINAYTSGSLVHEEQIREEGKIEKVRESTISWAIIEYFDFGFGKGGKSA